MRKDLNAGCPNRVRSIHTSRVTSRTWKTTVVIEFIDSYEGVEMKEN